MSQTDPEAGLRSIASTLFYHAGTLLPLIRIPVLILGGSEDRVVPTRRYAKMGRRIPGSRLVLLKGCSHQAITQAPDEVHTLVEEFLEDQGLLPGEDDSE
jgi:pimeloyl-ACP methyl ester carboxylesterase